LCATFGAGLLLWARLIIVSQVPRTAMAEQGQIDAGNEKSGSKGGKAGGGGATDKPGAKESTGASKKERPAMDVRLWSLSERDPFVISPLHFPKLSISPEVKQEAGKLPTEPAEDSTQKEARLVARLRELLGSFQLEAAMGNTMAVIDGKRYRVGDRLPVVGDEPKGGRGGERGGERVQFTLVEVRQRSAILEAQGRRFELEMSIPGSSDNPPPR
jgi:hypothetical protein